MQRHFVRDERCLGSSVIGAAMVQHYSGAITSHRAFVPSKGKPTLVTLAFMTSRHLTLSHHPVLVASADNQMLERRSHRTTEHDGQVKLFQSELCH
jgi:hypothetical protein